jgi:hypothetical protein
MHWSSTSKIGCTLLVDRYFPSVVNILVRRLSSLVIGRSIGNALLVDRLVLVLVNMFVNGLFNIFFGRLCYLVETLLETLVFAGLSAVKCLQIGLLLACASSLTFFILWSMTGRHRSSHFFNCFTTTDWLFGVYQINTLDDNRVKIYVCYCSTVMLQNGWTKWLKFWLSDIARIWVCLGCPSTNYMKKVQVHNKAKVKCCCATLSILKWKWLFEPALHVSS